MTTSTPLLTDLYQLTMAAGYWRSGKAEQEAVFHLFFRKLPFAGGYAIAAGLGEGGRYQEAKTPFLVSMMERIEQSTTQMPVPTLSQKPSAMAKMNVG